MSNTKPSPTYLAELISNNARESKRLEFKRQTYDGSKAGKREFLKDITALANTEGGLIIVGMEEDDGIAISIVPLSTSLDKEILRLESLARDAIEPRIPSLEFYEVEVDGGSVMAINVESSYLAPHRVTHEGHNKFYGRNAGGVFELDVAQLRELFNMSDFVERFENFVSSRLTRHERNDLPDYSDARPRLVMHAAPVWIGSRQGAVDLKRIAAQYDSFAPPRASGFGDTFNLDGLKIAATSSRGDTYAAIQIFRDGCMEVANSLDVLSNGGISIEQVHFILGELPRLLLKLREFGVDAELGITASLVGAAGHKLCPTEIGGGLTDREEISSQVVRLPAVLDRQSATKEELLSVIQPIRNAAWNGAGFQEAPRG